MLLARQACGYNYEKAIVFPTRLKGAAAYLHLQERQAKLASDRPASPEMGEQGKGGGSNAKKIKKTLDK